jgi:uncharacterized protein (TIGR01319 family)
METCLLIDFGSTYTKLTAVDLVAGEIMATASSFTTVSSDIKEGYHNALEKLYKKMNKVVKFDKTIACSSAAGGLKMAAIGLVEELTVEAAKRVCLGAGAKVELIFSHHITNHDIEKIIEKKIDIILLAGGTDGGNSENVLYNIKKLGEAHIKIPIIYAGNKSCQDDVFELMKKYDLNGFICDNIMAKLNLLNIDDAKNIIKQVFLSSIIVGKGIKKIEEEIDGVILPTPQAVLLACELLSKGYLHEKGLGDIVVFDIGGATTDVYSICSGTPKRSDVILKGLEEPFAKRTVEGDLGMRYSALGALLAISQEKRKLMLEEGIDIEKECNYRHNNVEMLPTTEHDWLVEEKIANICVDTALKRHVGKLESVYTTMGMMYLQTGKDLTDVNYIIGTGGVIINHPKPQNILSKSLASKDTLLELRPKQSKYLLDRDYILSAMGLLSTISPEVALKIMKKHLMLIEG